MVPVHGEIWTAKEFFTLPNEYIYWSVQIVMYPFMTGLVAGAFVLSSLYHVFGVKQLKEIARFRNRSNRWTRFVPVRRRSVKSFR